MEALKRKTDLSVRKSMTLADGTIVSVKGVSARQAMEIANNKKLSDVDKGVHLTAAKILVDGKPVVYDDLMDGFTDTELAEIMRFANDVPEDGGASKNV
jgi:hypothetical protein